MFKLKRIIVLVLIILCNFGYLFAWSFSSIKKPKPPVVTFAGKVIDKVTQRPIINAKIDIYISNIFSHISKQIFTDYKGEYQISIAGFSSARLARLTVTAREYTIDRSFLFIPSGSSTHKKDFKLRDVISPRLQICYPWNGNEILDNQTIVLRYYKDYGSGIDISSLKIYANEKEITKYARLSYRPTETTVICYIPQSDPLDKGECTITAQISDFAKNTSRRSVSVTVVPAVDYYIKLGKKALLKKDILSANSNFRQALSVVRDNPEANFYYAFTRLATLPFKYSIYTLFKDMSFTGQNGKPLGQYDLDPFHFKAESPAGIRDFNLLQSFPNPKRIQDMIFSEIIPEMDNALANLDFVLARKDFVSYLSAQNPITGTANIKIDYADAALLKSIICAIEANLYEFLVRNMDCDLAQLSCLFNAGTLTPEDVLVHYPDLLRVQQIPHSLKAKEKLIAAIECYTDAFNFMQAQTGDQSEDLISVSPEHIEDAKLFTEQVKDIKKSLLGHPDVVFSMKSSQLFNLGYLFDNPFDFREILGMKTIPYLLQNNFLPLMDYALNNLAKADVNYQEYLTPQCSFFEGKKKKADFTDIVAAKSALESMRTAFLSILGYNCDVDVQAMTIDAFKNRRINFNDILNAYPNLLKLSNQNNIISAKQALVNMVNECDKTAYYLLRENDMDQSDDILTLPKDFKIKESEYRMMLDKYFAMLIGFKDMKSTLIDPITGLTTKEIYVNTGEFFLNPKDIRGFLPQFDSNNRVIPDSFPDITFGNTVSGYELPDWLSD